MTRPTLVTRTLLGLVAALALVVGGLGPIESATAVSAHAAAKPCKAGKRVSRHTCTKKPHHSSHGGGSLPGGGDFSGMPTG